MTSTLLQAAEQGQRLKVMGGSYVEGVFVGRSGSVSFPWGRALSDMA